MDISDFHDKINNTKKRLNNKRKKMRRGRIEGFQTGSIGDMLDKLMNLPQNSGAINDSSTPDGALNMRKQSVWQEFDRIVKNGSESEKRNIVDEIKKRLNNADSSGVTYRLFKIKKQFQDATIPSQQSMYRGHYFTLAIVRMEFAWALYNLEKELNIIPRFRNENGENGADIANASAKVFYVYESLSPPTVRGWNQIMSNNSLTVVFKNEMTNKIEKIKKDSDEAKRIESQVLIKTQENKQAEKDKQILIARCKGVNDGIDRYIKTGTVPQYLKDQHKKMGCPAREFTDKKTIPPTIKPQPTCMSMNNKIDGYINSKQEVPQDIINQYKSLKCPNRDFGPKQVDINAAIQKEKKIVDNLDIEKEGVALGIKPMPKTTPKTVVKTEEDDDKIDTLEEFLAEYCNIL
jgi:hypothetical protein